MMATDGQVELMSLELSRIHHKAVEMSTKYRKGKIKLTYRHRLRDEHFEHPFYAWLFQTYKQMGIGNDHKVLMAMPFFLLRSDLYEEDSDLDDTVEMANSEEEQMRQEHMVLDTGGLPDNVMEHILHLTGYYGKNNLLTLRLVSKRFRTLVHRLARLAYVERQKKLKQPEPGPCKPAKPDCSCMEYYFGAKFWTNGSKIHLQMGRTFNVTALKSSVVLTMRYLFFVDAGHLVQLDRYTLQPVAELGTYSEGRHVDLMISGNVLLVSSKRFLNQVDLYSLADPIARQFDRITEDRLKAILYRYDNRQSSRKILVKNAMIVGEDVAIVAKVGQSHYAFVTRLHSIAFPSKRSLAFGVFPLDLFNRPALACKFAHETLVVLNSCGTGDYNLSWIATRPGHNFRVEPTITVGSFFATGGIYKMRCDPFSGDVGLSQGATGVHEYLIRRGSDMRQVLVSEHNAYQGPSHNSRAWHQGKFFRVYGKDLLVSKGDYDGWTVLADFDIDIGRAAFMTLDNRGLVFAGTRVVTVFDLPNLKQFF